MRINPIILGLNIFKIVNFFIALAVSCIHIFFSTPIMLDIIRGFVANYDAIIDRDMIIFKFFVVFLMPVMVFYLTFVTLNKIPDYIKQLLVKKGRLNP